MAKVDELWRDLNEADRMGDEELAAKIMARIKEEEMKTPEQRAAEDPDEVARKAIAGTDPKLQFARAAMNLPGDIRDKAVGAWDAITNPGETANQIAEGAGTMLRAQRGDIDPQTMMNVKEGVEQVAEDPVEAMVQNPVDTAMMFGGGPLMSSLKPIKGLSNLAKKGMGAASDEMYRWDMGIPKSELDKGKDIARHGARSGIAKSRRGLKKVEAATDELNERLNHMIEKQSDNLNMINKDVIQDHFNDLINKYAGTPGGDKNIEKLFNQMDEFLNDLGDRQMVTPEELHKFKTSAYEQAYTREAIGETVDEKVGPETKGLRSAGRGAKEALETKMPEYGPVNEQWAGYAKLKPYVDRAVDKPWSDDLLGNARDVVKAMAPVGSRSAIVLRKMADTDIAELVQKYSPQQVKYMLSKVNADNAMVALWAEGAYDEILNSEGGGW